MRHVVYAIMLGIGLVFSSCTAQKKSNIIIEREFLHDAWERFDYVYSDIEIQSPTTYDLSMDLYFTEEYEYAYFAMDFVVFDANGDPYRARTYNFGLEDENGWKSEQKGGLYHFSLPINKELLLSDAGSYRMQIENRMPITPVMGVRKLTLSTK